MIPLYEISNKELSALKWRRIAQDVSNGSYTELWLTPDSKKVVKLFSDNETIRDFFAADIENDIFTLLALSNASNRFDNRFVLPDTIYQQQSRIVGYSMPYIKGQPMSRINHLITDDFKQIVQQVYADILYVNNTNFSLADLHEDNIILNSDGIIRHIDLDGWYCGNGKGRRSRYLTYQKEKLSAYTNKYKSAGGYIIPCLNSDLFCLIHIILNYLLQSGFYFAEMTDDTQEHYLQYIIKYCNGSGIVRMYETLFSNEDNYIDMSLIHSLPNDISMFSYDTFIRRTSKFKTCADAEAFLRQNEIKIKKLRANL